MHHDVTVSAALTVYTILFIFTLVTCSKTTTAPTTTTAVVKLSPRYGQPFTVDCSVETLGGKEELKGLDETKRSISTIQLERIEDGTNVFLAIYLIIMDQLIVNDTLPEGFNKSHFTTSVCPKKPCHIKNTETAMLDFTKTFEKTDVGCYICGFKYLAIGDIWKWKYLKIELEAEKEYDPDKHKKGNISEWKEKFVEQETEQEFKGNAWTLFLHDTFTVMTGAIIPGMALLIFFAYGCHFWYWHPQRDIRKEKRAADAILAKWEKKSGDQRKTLNQSKIPTSNVSSTSSITSELSDESSIGSPSSLTSSDEKIKSKSTETSATPLQKSSRQVGFVA